MFSFQVAWLASTCTVIEEPFDGNAPMPWLDSSGEFGKLGQGLVHQGPVNLLACGVDHEAASTW
jgi:hypothetical protein